MPRLFLFIPAIALAAAGSAHAGSTMWSGGTANWFYQCANREPMAIIIRHRDRTTTQFSLGPGETLRTQVQRGDVVATRCDDRFVPLGLDKFTSIVTVP